MIYLDYNATTPIDPIVVEAMLPYLRDFHGNPSSSNEAGRRMRRAVDGARLQVAEVIGATPDEIVFTSSGTEANNQVLRGLAHLHRDRSPHFVISAIEHPAIDHPCRFLEAYGVETTRVPVDRQGVVDPDDVRRAMTPQTVLVSIMHANNEVGTIQPIAEIASIAHQGGALMHSDAAQSLGKISVHVDDLGVDFLSVAGHKLYAPQGVGALYLRNGVELPALLLGAGHERGRRAGTEAVPAIVGLGAAAELASSSLDERRLQTLRDQLHQKLKLVLGDRMVLNGHPTQRLPNTLNVSFPGLIGAEVLAATPGIAASSGPACHSNNPEPSTVLTAMGTDRLTAIGAVRLSVGRYNTLPEMDEAAVLLSRTVQARLRH